MTNSKKINKSITPKFTRPPVVYFAGKVSHGGGYRGKLLGNHRVMSDGHREYEVTGRRLIYGGPFAISCDHGCFHTNGTHGWASTGYESGYFSDENGHSVYTQSDDNENHEFSKFNIVDRCFSQIKTCDAVYAYIDSTDCYGTLTELGAASALGKPIYLVFCPTTLDVRTHCDFLEVASDTEKKENQIFSMVAQRGIDYLYDKEQGCTIYLKNVWDKLKQCGYDQSDFVQESDISYKARCKTDQRLSVVLTLATYEHTDELWFIKHLPGVVHCCYDIKPIIHSNLLFNPPKPQRPKISKSLRYDILKSARFRCQACGVSAADSQMHIDHIYPRSQGGKDDISNYTVLCEACNNGKRDKVPDNDTTQRLRLNQLLDQDYFSGD
jgi:nucleoside 2-deoxyribosyltransferase